MKNSMEEPYRHSPCENNAVSFIIRSIPMAYTYDSRNITQGDHFICLPGGEPYINAAKEKGAASVLHMSRSELANFANKHFDYPSHPLKVVGVTGTNGKTTVTHLVADALNKAGYKTAILGTLNASLTTPESWDIAKKMSEHLADGGTHFVMEVSSHGIAQNRILGIKFHVKLLTNISQDHLDYHKTFEAYEQTKRSFMQDGDGINLYPEEYQKTPLDFTVPLLGRFNYENMQAAATILNRLGLSEGQIRESLSAAHAPRGRFESIDEGQPYRVIVDYAHTPDGLRNVLQTARDITPDAHVLVLFGCGGDRDRTKRPEMGRIAYNLSDYTVITSDNPRTEDPHMIINDILTGLPPTIEQTRCSIIPDRRTAIRHILEKAQPGDLVMLAGKGHETYQITQSGTQHFDDREEAIAALKDLA